ncbi:MAG: aminopeptidase P family protein [Phycisphaerales bacterium]|nr:aminopeptidase P family protein [Phycisphaerales bacterium]
MPEIQNKLRHICTFLDRHHLDGLILQQRNNFAWITGGGNNFVANNATTGVASIYVTRNQRICLTNTIEAPRFATEELADTGIEVIDAPWYDRSAITQRVREIVGGGRIACDGDDFGIGAAPLPADFAELRWALEPEEIARYQQCGVRTSQAMERTCHEIKPGMSEHEVAGLLAHHVHDQGLIPVVNLIAADDRIARYRHPIPTDNRLRRYIMLVICAEYKGLIANLTRFVCFGPLSPDLKARQQAVADVDAAVNLATRPGRTLGDVFADLVRAYDACGHADQWKLHHQGGSTGYAGREVFATPDSDIVVRENQAFAWNPSITGVKSEDTILVTSSGIQMLTPTSGQWPMIVGRSRSGELARADILVR